MPALLFVPPPVNGRSLVNLQVGSHIEKRMQTVYVTSSTLVRWHRGRLRGRIDGLAVIAAKLLSRPRTEPFYFAVSGGSGQLIEIALVALARVSGRRIVLHHHSFAYLNQQSTLFGALARLAGRQALHVTLGSTMTDRLRQRYPSVNECLEVSNASIAQMELDAVSCLSDTAPMSTQGGNVTLGFLGNLSEDKGFPLAVETFLRCRRPGDKLEIVGPPADAKSAHLVEQLGDADDVSVLGPLFGEHKLSAMARWDILLFPSSYSNEAEPLTIHEALALGATVLATPVGCIPELSEYLPAVVVSEMEALEESLAALMDLVRNDSGKERGARADQWRTASLASRHQLEKLVGELTAP